MVIIVRDLLLLTPFLRNFPVKFETMNFAEFCCNCLISQNDILTTVDSEKKTNSPL